MASGRLKEKFDRCKSWGLDSHALLGVIEPQKFPLGGPLESLSFVIKDSFALESLPTSFGIEPPIIGSSSTSALIIDRLVLGGATLLGVANLDELALGAMGNNRYFGRIPNPRFPEFFAGGSSGGSAAAVAGGCADFALGTDWGGSVRIPAACCGVFGFKCSSGSVPRSGAVLYHPVHDTIGILADDIETAFRVWEVADGRPCTADSNEYRLESIQLPSGYPVSEVIRERYSRAIELVAAKTPITQARSLPPFEEARSLRRSLAPGLVRDLVRAWRIPVENLPDQAKALLAMAGKEEASYPDSGLEVYKSQWPHSLVLVTPCFPMEFPVRIDSRLESDSVASSTYFLELANILDCPACTVSARHYGISLQFIGPPGGDAHLWNFIRGLRNRELARFGG